MNTKNVILGMAIAAVLLIAAGGSASAVTVINSCNFNANTLNEYYVLGQNLTCSGSEHGINIGASNITIDGYNETDGKYYWIDGGSPATCDPFTYWSGIYDVGGYDQVTIRNLEILHFCNGILLRETALNEYYTIENCKIHDIGTGPGTQGINLKMLNHGTVKGCEIYNVDGEGAGCEGGGDGIFLIGYAAMLGYGRNNTFTCNNIHNNRKGGIFIKGSPDLTTISYNHLWENGESSAGEVGGIILRCKQSSDNTIEYNNASNNVGDGIYIGGANNTMRYNTVTNNKNSIDDLIKGIGLRVQRCGESDWGGYPNPDNNTIYNNTFCGSEFMDIEVSTACISHINGDYNTGDTCTGYTGDTSAPAGQCCVYTCDNLLTRVYYDFDSDNYYSKDLEDCLCGIVGSGECACCNPGLFNGTGVTQHCAGGVCNQTVGNDPNDCDASVKPELTYTISGTTTPAADTVNITNLNNSKEWAASIDGNFYTLTLNVDEDVNATEILRIIACDVPDNYTSNCNRTDHTVVTAPGEETVNLILNHYCQNYYPTFPYRTWEQSNWSGPAAMQMLVDHYRLEEPAQSYLNETGIAHNQVCNADLLFVDPAGMQWTLNHILHNTGSYGGGKYANYGVGSSTTIDNVLHYMCKWHYAGPGAAPAYGNYSNWMVVRGIHTDKKPSFTQGTYEIYGFWMNDPYNETLEGPGGIGENTYKSVEQWKDTYHLKLNKSDVNMSDYYYDKYVAVCEPPEDDDVEVTLAKPKPRLATAITPMLAEEPMMMYGVKQLALEKVVKDDELLKIVKATIDGVNEELVPYDSDFAAVFAKTVPGKPMLVSSDNGDYYVVPFNVPVEVRLPVKKMPVEIERPKISGLKKLERMKLVADKIELKPIPIELIKVEKTLVVVLVDAEDGSFKEASWVADPVKYLPVSKIEAMELALGEVLDELHMVARKDARDLEVLKSKPTIVLVHRDASPYYPDWKIIVDGKVFYVGQDGTVSN